ncbi:hypothetical protein E3V08_06160 [Candidatus Atribacteria bacterium MT.SAG.1]|nr:hypothetical protein E3V08_06160 [Candidatus Atribacteria bacterium MT.SAG.1]
MKEKILTTEEFLKDFKLEGKLEFSKKSTIGSISVSPEKTLFFARHWNSPTVVSVNTGTAYTCRIGDSPYNFDFDVVSFRRDKKGVIKVVHVYTNYHHTNEIPPFIEDQMPDDFKKKVQFYLNER